VILKGISADHGSAGRALARFASVPARYEKYRQRCVLYATKSPLNGRITGAQLQIAYMAGALNQSPMVDS
jgi:hypothetical protein